MAQRKKNDQRFWPDEFIKRIHETNCVLKTPFPACDVWGCLQNRKISNEAVAIFLLTRKGSEAGSQWTLLGRRILQLDVAGLHEKAALLPHDPELPHFDGNQCSACSELSWRVHQSVAVSVPQASWPRLGLKPASRGNPRSFPFRRELKCQADSLGCLLAFAASAFGS